MFAIPNAQHADVLRSEFEKCVLSDWRKILCFVAQRGIISSQQCLLLLDALGELESIGQRIRTELFWSYFRALESVRTDPLSEATRFRILSLGNALIEPLAENGAARSIPVWTAGGGWVHLPGAIADRAPALRANNGTLEAEDLAVFRQRILDAVNASWILTSSNGIALRGPTHPVLIETARYSEEISRVRRLMSGNANRTNLVVLDPSTVSGSSILNQYKKAAEFIGEIDAELAGELSILTEYVVPLDGDNDFVGGSALTLYGATFLKLKDDWSVLCYADHLVHEAAHQLLHAEDELHPLLLNRDYVGAPSPIRSDPRPLHGTFHATFVFLRLSLFMHSVLLRTPQNEIFDEAVIRFHRHLLGLLQGLEVLMTHGEFTPQGWAELDHWAQIASGLRDAHGGPDADICARLNWDYEPPWNFSVPKRFRRSGDYFQD